MRTLQPLILPDLGLGDRVVTASAWLVEPGAEVLAGDRMLEVLCGSVTVDLPAPADGVLVETLVEDDDRLEVGQLLAIIESEL
jgi:pyruvate/2-oxoglutarate dehydrogenase complex dihydrolipoamide acyltransferase (E2) component